MYNSNMNLDLSIESPLLGIYLHAEEESRSDDNNKVK